MIVQHIICVISVGMCVNNVLCWLWFYRPVFDLTGFIIICNKSA